MEYSIKNPTDVAQMVDKIIKDTREGHHKVEVTLAIEDGEIKMVKVE